MEMRRARSAGAAVMTVLLLSCGGGTGAPPPGMSAADGGPDGGASEAGGAAESAGGMDAAGEAGRGDVGAEAVPTGDAGLAADGAAGVDLARDAGGEGPDAGASMVRRCAGKMASAGPGNIQSVLGQYRGAEVVIEMAPGTYPQFSASGIACLELRCTAPAIVNGAPNPDGCKVTRSLNVTSVRNLVVEGLVFVNDNVSSGSSADYGIALYEGTEYVRVVKNAFNGNMNHDISTKNTVSYIEVLENLFVRCMRHCFEIGQNGNIPSRPSTGVVAIVRGNVFDSPRIHALTQRYNRTLVVEDNEFRNVSGNAVNNWPFWTLYSGEQNLVPRPPLRTSVVGNRFVGASKMTFEGRGVRDDVVLVRGNSGPAPACVRIPMDAETAAAHSDEETTDPPQLDPASDLPCPTR